MNQPLRYKKIMRKANSSNILFSFNNLRMFSPKIDGLQDYNMFELNKPVPVEKNMGLILILSSKK